MHLLKLFAALKAVCRFSRHCKHSQNLKKLRVPIIDAIPKSAADKIIIAYYENNIAEINRLITPIKISEYEFTEGQMTLFEPEGLYLQG